MPLYNFIPKKQLIKCVENRKELMPVYVKPGNLGLENEVKS